MLLLKDREAFAVGCAEKKQLFSMRLIDSQIAEEQLDEFGSKLKMRGKQDELQCGVIWFYWTLLLRRADFGHFFQ